MKKRPKEFKMITLPKFRQTKRKMQSCRKPWKNLNWKGINFRNKMTCMQHFYNKVAKAIRAKIQKEQFKG